MHPVVPVVRKPILNVFSGRIGEVEKERKRVPSNMTIEAAYSANTGSEEVAFK